MASQKIITSLSVTVNWDSRVQGSRVFSQSLAQTWLAILKLKEYEFFNETVNATLHNTILQVFVI